MTASTSMPWHEANLLYLREEVERLRRLLARDIRRRMAARGGAPPQYAGAMVSDVDVARALETPVPRGRADGAIAAVGAEHTANLERLRRALADRDPPPADALAELFGLTPFERDVLLLAFAPELDPGFETLYAYLHEDVTRRYVSPQLALAALAGDGDWLAARDSFLPTAPLRRYRLVELGHDPRGSGALATRSVRLDERITDYLLGVDRLDELAATVVTKVAQSPADPSHAAFIESVAGWAARSAEAGGPRVLNLTGPGASGTRSFASSLCARLELGLYELVPRRLELAGSDPRDLLRLVEREALLSGFAVYVDVTDQDPQASTASPLIRDQLLTLQPLLIVGSRHPLDLGPHALSIALQKPDRGAQRQMWAQALNGAGGQLDDCIRAIVEQFDFGPDDIARTASRAAGRISAFGESARSSSEELWQASREQAGHDLEQLARRIRPCYGWDDIVVSEDVMRQLREIAAQVEYRATVYEDWGFGAKLSRGRGISALFAGPSGTGKTMAAEVLASHLKLDLYRVDLASTVSKYVGETEKNLARIFDAAERSGAILFFDEADALFSKRVEVKDGHDRYANIETNYLLQRMEDYRGLAILATNRKANLDDAFMRRLRFLVDFPAPDAALRRKIWQRCLPAHADVALDFGFLSRLDIPGGNIRNISLNAAFLAAPEGGPISLEHVLHAARREYAKIDKLVVESEFGPFYDRVRR